MENRELKTTGKTGMWLFISTEILLFGGLFLLYSMYRFKNPADFHAASIQLSRLDGTLNTCLLITSSLTAALAVSFFKKEKSNLSNIALLCTAGLAFAFLTVKGFEWSEKFRHGLYPNAAELLSRPKGEILYFGLYFTMTGLHALHVIIGIGIFTAVFILVSRGKLKAGHPAVFENCVLYWHLVDIIWIFLFPLFYLIT